MRGLTAHMLYVDRPRIQRDNPWLVVHELPEGVGDMLDAIRACLGGLDDDSLVDRQKSHYVRLIQHDEVAGHDRVLQATFDVGRFGEIGGNRRVDDHHPTHDYGPDEASVVALRVLFVVPKEARMALMFCERSYPYSAGTSLRRALIDYWDEQGWGERLSLRMSSVVYPDAWLEAAQVEAFEATSHGHQSDIEGISNGQGQPIGTLKLTVVPETQGIAQRIMRRIREDPAVQRARILGISGISDEVEAVRARLVDEDGKTKTVNIDNARPPAMAWELTPNEGDPQHPNDLVNRALEECPEIYRTVQVEWHDV